MPARTTTRAALSGDLRHEHSPGSPSGRGPARSPVVHLRPAACAGDVCRCGGGAVDSRQCPGLDCGPGGFTDQRQPVDVRRCHPDPDPGLLALRRTLAVDPGLLLHCPGADDHDRQAVRPGRGVRRGDRRRGPDHCHGAAVQPSAEVLSTGGDRQSDHHHRHFFDAGGGRLAGGRQPRRRGFRRTGQPVAGAGHRGGDPGDLWQVLRLYRQPQCADRAAGGQPDRCGPAA